MVRRALATASSALLVVLLAGLPVTAQDDVAIVTPKVTSLDFGDVGVDRFVELDVVVANGGGAKAVFRSFEFDPSGGFHLVDHWSSVVPGHELPPNYQRPIKLHFIPTQVGDWSTTLTVTYALTAKYREPRTDSFEVSLTGRGTASSPAPPGCGLVFPDEGGYVRHLERGTVLCGGTGNDQVVYMRGGTFRAGGGDDKVNTLLGGIYYGQAGDDETVRQEGGRFVGGPGEDELWRQLGGVFEGLDGSDQITYQHGTFLGGAGEDVVVSLSEGLYDGGPGDDAIKSSLSGGVFLGGPGNDDGDSISGGVFKGGPGNDFALRMTGGVFRAGSGHDRVQQAVKNRGTRFKGGPGADRVQLVSDGAVFNGARGNDRVTMYLHDGGTFHGGPGRDVAVVCDSTNTLTNVEVRSSGC